MDNSVLGLISLITVLIGYIVRIERALAKLKTDVCWIKQSLAPKESK